MYCTTLICIDEYGVVFIIVYGKKIQNSKRFCFSSHNPASVREATQKQSALEHYFPIKSKNT